MTAGSHLIDVDETNFEVEVLERSKTQPVLVDFWADWCGPCRALGPVLEKVAAESNGRFVLAKLDTERSPRLAQAFSIQSIPAVKLIRDGRVIGEFVGALPEPEVRRFLDAHLPSDADRLVEEARELLDADPDRAVDLLHDAVGHDAEHPGAHMELARIALAHGRTEEAGRHARAVAEHQPEAADAAAILQAIAFREQCTEAGGEDACRARIEADENDLDARFALGLCLAAASRYEEALESLYSVMERDRGWKDGKAREAMVTIFGIIGQRSELADQYRRKLAMLI